VTHYRSSTSSIARELPTACVRVLRPTVLVIVPMLTSRQPNLAWRASHPVRTSSIARDLPAAHARRCDPLPLEHEFYRARVAHGVCESAATHRAHDCANVHLSPPKLGVARSTSHEDELHRARLAHSACEALPLEHEFYCVRVAHGVCESAATHCARDRVNGHLSPPELGVALHMSPVRMSSIMHELPTACARHCNPLLCQCTPRLADPGDERPLNPLDQVSVD